MNLRGSGYRSGVPQNVEPSVSRSTPVTPERLACSPAAEDLLQSAPGSYRDESPGAQQSGDNENRGGESTDVDDRHDAICGNLHIVSVVARKYRDTGESPDDLLSAGYIGLIKAVDGFDPTRGVKFSTYATHMIDGEIRHHLRDRTGVIRRPRWLTGVSRRMGGFIEHFLQDHQRLPTLQEIGQGINVSLEGVAELLRARAVHSIESLDTDVAVDRIRSQHYESFRLPLEDRIVLQQTLERLKQVEQRVVFLFFYQDLTQTEIARSLGVSQKKVSRLLARSLLKLRDFLTREL